MTQSVPVLGAHTVTLPVIPWRTETPALQPRKSPIHLSNSSSQPRFLVSSLKASRTFFVSQPNAKKGTCTVGRCCLRSMASSASPESAKLTK